MKFNLIVASLIAALALSLGLLTKIGITNYKLRHQSSTLSQELAAANLEKGQALTLVGETGSKVNSLEEDLQDSLRDLNLQVTRYVELEAKYKVLKSKKGQAQVAYYPGDDIQVDCPNVEFIRGLYYEAVTNFSLAEVKSMANIYKDHRLTARYAFVPRPNTKRFLASYFDYELDLRIKAQLVETVSTTGVINHFVNIYEVTPEGDQKFELTNFEVTVDDQRLPHFQWWTPHLDIAALGTTSGVGASLGISVAGYGKTENDLSWRFVRLSLDIFDKPAIGFTPFVYNVGGPMPLISNLYLGPHVGWKLDKGYVGLLLGSVL